MTTNRTTVRLSDADTARLRTLAAALGLFAPNLRGVGNISGLLERLATVAATPAGAAALATLLTPRPTPTGDRGTGDGTGGETG